uniref:Uncharacterized protein n=1 Tax=Helianthus annuus TaxID=4232 RepID=A0A251S3A6_HELAN
MALGLNLHLLLLRVMLRLINVRLVPSPFIAVTLNFQTFAIRFLCLVLPGFLWSDSSEGHG